MEQVVVLDPKEPAWFERERVHLLWQHLGPLKAEELVVQSVEHLSMMLVEIDNLYTAGREDEIQPLLAVVGTVSEQIGLIGLSLAACNLCDALRGQNPVAISATLARMLRMGEISVGAVWDIEDFIA